MKPSQLTGRVLLEVFTQEQEKGQGSWGSQNAGSPPLRFPDWTMLLKLKGPLQRRHSLSDAIIMMDRSVVGLPSCPWGPVGLSDLCEATGGSFNSELGEMSPQFHQLGGQNCI